MAQEPNGKITFVPDARIVTFDQDTVEIRTGVWHTVSITLSDESKKGVLSDVITAIVRGSTPQQIAENHGVTLDEVIEVVERLNQNGLLTLTEGLERWDRLPYLVGSTLGSVRAVKPARAYLFGPAYATTFVKHAMGNGLAAIETVELEQDKLSELMTRDLFLDRDGLQMATAIAPYEEWRGSLVVAILPQFNPILPVNVNRLAHLVGFSFLPVCVDGPFAMLGPTVVPSKSACYACAEARVLESMRDHTLYQTYRRAALEGKVHTVEANVIDPFQSSIFSLAAWELSNFAAFGTAFTIDKILTIYAPTMEIVFHELLRMPGCAVCSPRYTMDGPLYSDLMSFINERLKERKQ